MIVPVDSDSEILGLRILSMRTLRRPSARGLCRQRLDLRVGVALLVPEVIDATWAHRAL